MNIERPKIVCLCGSTRFIEAFRVANYYETMDGKIVLSIGCDTKSDEWLNLTPMEKSRLDSLHLRKIELADEVLFLNVGGYIGKSTKSELVHALAFKKPIRWLEPKAGEEYLERNSHELGKLVAERVLVE